MKRTSLLVAACFAALHLFAQNVPSPRSFLGYEIGQRFTPHHKIVGYFEALAKAAPNRMKLEYYGTTNEGRPLMLAFVASAENLANLDNIRQNNLKLTGLMGGGGNAAAPAIVWMSYNVHGNEASSSEAVMKTAHFLLTDPKGQEWLKNTVVILDPCINPDGRDRYVNWFNSVAGDIMNPDPAAREHAEPWPGGRSNHYNFDLNRDWAWQTQVETQQRLVKYNQWMPHIHVDFHEQGYNEPYYFAPAAEPFHEVITPWQRDFQTRIGRNHARYFDANGWLYFTRERFDLFYPSYGDTWPTYNGGIGMTYEQGGHSRGGLGIINEDGDTLTLTDRAIHHHTTGISTVEMASQHATDLVKNFQQFFAEARKNGVGEYKSFVIKAADAGSKLKRLMTLLQKNGIEYAYAQGGSARGFNYTSGKEENFSLEKGDLVVSTTQVKGALAKVLFEPMSKLSDSATYDITAWSIPYAFGLQAFAVKESVASAPANAVPLPARVYNENDYGYVVKWQSMQEAGFLAACLKAGIKPRMSEKPFEVNGVSYPAGTLIFIKTSNNGVAGYHQQLTKLAAEHGVDMITVKTGFMDKGADFGSPDVKTIHAPRILMATGEGTSSLGAGELWHYFDRELKYPVTMVNVRELAGVRWNRYDVVVLPDGSNYRALFEKEGPLRTWVQQGGKLIVMENAAAQLARADWGLTFKKSEEPKGGEYDLLKKFEDREKESLKDNNPGSIFRVEMDNSHPLGFGYKKQYFTLKSDDMVYEFLKDGWNVGVIKKESQVSGFTGVRAKARLQDGVLFGEIPMGRGTVVFMADDVLFRSFWESGKLMMANALFLVNQGNNFRL
ncbi:MAG: M14 family metallopeptidase [Chitinophagaceae bacterium]|nr:M14 family metallopeptidase [Chitinophagaceae bacterium]